MNKGLKRQRNKMCRYQGARAFQVVRTARANVLGQQSGWSESPYFQSSSNTKVWDHFSIPSASYTGVSPWKSGAHLGNCLRSKRTGTQTPTQGPSAEPSALGFWERELKVQRAWMKKAVINCPFPVFMETQPNPKARGLQKRLQGTRTHSTCDKRPGRKA